MPNFRGHNRRIRFRFRDVPSGFLASHPGAEVDVNRMVSMGRFLILRTL